MPISFATLAVDQYADFSYTWTWYAANVQVNLTGATARLMCRQNPSDAVPLFSISTTASATGLIVLGGALGTVQVKIAKGQAGAAITTGTLPGYDLLIDWPTGITTELLAGQILVKPGYTH